MNEKEKRAKELKVMVEDLMWSDRAYNYKTNSLGAWVVKK